MEGKRVDKELAKEFSLTALDDLKSAKLKLDGKVLTTLFTIHTIEEFIDGELKFSLSIIHLLASNLIL